MKSIIVANIHPSEAIIHYQLPSSVGSWDLYRVTSPYGYSGDIQLLIISNAQKIIQSVRVLKHQETPGLGDKIEIGKSNWLLNFEQRSLTTPHWSNGNSNKQVAFLMAFQVQPSLPEALFGH